MGQRSHRGQIQISVQMAQKMCQIVRLASLITFCKHKCYITSYACHKMAAKDV